MDGRGRNRWGAQGVSNSNNEIYESDNISVLPAS